MTRVLRWALWSFAVLWTALALAIVTQDAAAPPLAAAGAPAVVAIVLALALGRWTLSPRARPGGARRSVRVLGGARA